MTEPLPHPATPPIPANEPARLAALHRYKILDTPPEVAFDRITTLAARLFNMPIALISLVDESRAWFKSCIGFDAREVPREDTLCSFALLTDEPLIVPDAQLDDRFACNPFVQSEPGVRFYASAPLLSRDGFNLGTLCLLDGQPRDALSAEQQATLVDLAAMVVDELELRLAAHQIAQVDAALMEITQGVATVTGVAYFDALVQHFAKVLDVDYAYIGLVADDDAKVLRTIATCAHGQIVENLAYPLQETPCWEVIQQGKICCYPRNVQAQFPNAPLLKPLSVESYVAIPFFDSSGTPLGLLGVMDSKPLENVQLAESLLVIFALRIAPELERQQAEAVLQDSEAQTRNILESITDGFFALDQDWRFTYVNPQAERILNRTPGDLLGKVIWEVYPGTVGTEFERAYRRTASERVASSLVSFYPDHSCWYEVYAYPATDGITVYFRDVTDRKQAEEALRNSAEQLSLALTAAKLGDWSWDAATDIVTFSEQAAETFGIPPGPYMTWTQMQDLLHPDDRERARSQVEQAIANHSDYDVEYRVIHADQTERWVAAKGRAQYDPLGQLLGMLGVVQDVSHRKQAEVERERLLAGEKAARKEAETANRIKDEFLAVLSHELRSPLNPILGWARLLHSGKLNPVRTAEALATIERNAKLQAQLIEDLLDVSRILQGKLLLNAAPVSLAFVISSAIETVRLAAEAKRIGIEVHIEPNIGQTTGDAGRLQQVVWNLLTNAVKFTPAGGGVEVRLTQVNRQACLQVSDTGKGIAPEFLPYVFEHFRQEDGATTRKFGGLGLGLAIVRQIVELHGGRVWADSEGENRGATFTVQLPLNLPAQLDEPDPPRDGMTTEAALSNLQILLVDDEPDTREFQAFVLEQSGATVTAVASGLEALQALDRFMPDLLVSDIGMADMDGYMLMQQIRSREALRSNSRPPDRGTIPAFSEAVLPAIALTAYAGELNQRKAIASGFQAHLTKPVEPEKLVRAIVSLVTGEAQ